MQTLDTIRDLRSVLSAWRGRGERVAFVPTLGNLHAGHLRLFHDAQHLAQCVVVSIFVNPLQFDRQEDFRDYPRTLEEDARALAEMGIDLLFAPAVEEVYPQGMVASVFVEVPGLSDILCGADRPGHFRGVATVVTKLFNIVQPDVALFGEKDYQQLQVIRRLVADLFLPVEIVAVPTMREPDGLAMSSRNNYLNQHERRRAPNLHQALHAAAARIERGETDLATIEAGGMEMLRQAGFRPEYFSARRAQDLRPPGPDDTDLVLLTAAWLGKARLIDNVRATLKL